MSKDKPLDTFYKEIAEQSPLVHNITNYVVMNNTANALLAIGASPVMAHAIEEVEDITAIASSLVINIGTLSPQWVNAMQLAMSKANELNKPIVLDPVGVGASKYRTETALALLAKSRVSVIRANASEIMALANHQHTTKGVDNTIHAESALQAAQELSKAFDSTVVISGETDYIITDDRLDHVKGGNAMMTKVTGLGCTATSIIGACVSIMSDHHMAAYYAMTIMAEAGNMASQLSQGPSSFQMHFIDALYQVAGHHESY